MAEEKRSEIWGQVSITKQIVQYEPIKLEAGAKLPVDDVANEEAWKKLWDTLEAQLEAQIKGIFEDE